MEDSKQPPIDVAFSTAVARAVDHLAHGGKGRNQAATLLLQECGGRLRNYLKRLSYRQAADQDVEEILLDIILAFVTEPIPPGCNPQAWLYRIARNALIDWARKRNAEKRGGPGNTDIDLDDDEMGNLFDTALGHIEIPSWVRDCIQKAAAYMQQVNPQRAEVLFMLADGWSAQDIAIAFGADVAMFERTDPASKKAADAARAAARDRIYRARLEGQGHFSHCKE